VLALSRIDAQLFTKKGNILPRHAELVADFL
jgi:hypothetical protein